MAVINISSSSLEDLKDLLKEEGILSTTLRIDANIG